ncbi:MAG: tetratricopeptide repeat protein [Coleofasciculus sp. G3-WIS-01]|uniref:tetratricopeptide repeat protein n=1 Tax=Coleofasciculus sp. G3-WIS-01 TaxID=3069528 RepID=UPI003304BE3C
MLERGLAKQGSAHPIQTPAWLSQRMRSHKLIEYPNGAQTLSERLNMTMQQPDQGGKGDRSPDVLSPEQAWKLLTALLGKERMLQDRGARKVLPLLCEWLGYLSLGIELVGRYLAQHPDLSLTDILKRLEAQRYPDQTTKPPSQPTLQWGINTILEYIWRELNPITQQVGQLLSLFASTLWRWQWLESASDFLHWRQADLNQAQTQLDQWRLIESVANRQGCYKVQPLIREFFRKKLEALDSPAIFVSRPPYPFPKRLSQPIPKPPQPDSQPLPKPISYDYSTQQTPPPREWHSFLSPYPGVPGSGENCPIDQQLYFPIKNPTCSCQRDNSQIANSGVSQKSKNKAPPFKKLHADDFRQAFTAIVVELVQQIPDSPTPEQIRLLEEILPHIQEIVQTLESAVRDEDSLCLFDSLGKFYKGQGLTDLLWLFDRLGRFYQHQGMVDQAESWFRHCISIAQAAFGEEHLDVATSLNNLAGLYYTQGRYSEAEPLYLQALEVRKHLLGNHHIDVATSLNNLAGLYYAQGRYSEAEPLYLQALELRKSLLGNYHLDVASSLNNLGLLYYAQGRYSEAEPLYLQSLELRKSLLDNCHPGVATSINNLAGLYNSQKRYTEAESLLVQALSLSEQHLGDDHPNTAIFRKNLSIIRTKMKANRSWWQWLGEVIQPKL